MLGMNDDGDAIRHKMETIHLFKHIESVRATSVIHATFSQGLQTAWLVALIILQRGKPACAEKEPYRHSFLAQVVYYRQS
jgi:hypothetical protein